MYLTIYRLGTSFTVVPEGNTETLAKINVFQVASSRPVKANSDVLDFLGKLI